MSGRRSGLALGEVKAFYESDVVITCFNDAFAGRWHTRVVPDLPGVADSMQYLCGVLGIRPWHSVLDFGSGVGVTTCDIARIAGCRIRGLNISSKQVEISKQYAWQAHLTSRMSFDLYGGREFPYGDHTFDRVIFFESPCQVPDKDLLFGEIFRVLKPGGMCGGQDWMRTDGELVAGEYENYIQPIEIAFAVDLRSIGEYRGLLRRGGFSLVRAWDARSVCGSMDESFAMPSPVPVQVNLTERDTVRLSRGNLALSNAFHKGLFTVGFVCGVKELELR